MPPKIKLLHEVRGDAMPLHLRFGNTFWENVGKEILAGIMRNVRGQKRSDGSRQKVNAKSTQAAKKAKGRKNLSLVDDPKRLRLSTRSKYRVAVAKNAVAIGPKAQDISEWVQEAGYTGWMAPDKISLIAIRKLIALEIARASAKAAKVHKRGPVR